MDQLKDSIDQLSTLIETVEGRVDHVSDEVNAIQYELYPDEPNTFASKITQALIQLQATADRLLEIIEDSSIHKTY
jgi:hypothetical protein